MDATHAVLVSILMRVRIYDAAIFKAGVLLKNNKLDLVAHVDLDAALLLRNVNKTNDDG